MEKEEWDVLREDLRDTYLLLGIITVVIYSIAFYFDFSEILPIIFIIIIWIITIGLVLYGLEIDDTKFIAGGIILSIFFDYLFISSGMSSNQPVYLRIFAFIYFNQFWLAPLITLILRAKGVKISLKAMGERANAQQKLPESRRTSGGDERRLDERGNNSPIYLVVIKDPPAPVDGPEYLKKITYGKHIEPLAEHDYLMIKPVQQIGDETTPFWNKQHDEQTVYDILHEFRVFASYDQPK